MPYNGDIYSPPAGTKGAPKTTIQSSKYNTFLDDITAAQNAARPLTGGGTGATNATQARENLGIDKVLQYGAAQTLTEAEKTQALANIFTGLTAAQKGQVIANIGGGALAGFRNKIRNGDFAINQRGNRNLAPGENMIVLDGWYVTNNTNQTVGVSQAAFAPGQVDVPGEPGFYMNLNFPVAPTTGTVGITQRIESVRTLAGKKATVTAYTSGPAANGGALTCTLGQNFGVGGSPSGSVLPDVPLNIGTVYDAATRKRQGLVDLPPINGKTLGTTNDGYVALAFTLTPRASGNYLIAHVSVVEGDATKEDDPFAPRHSQQEVDIIQRYYQRIHFRLRGYQVAGAFLSNGKQLPVVMRTTPTAVRDETSISVINMNAVGIEDLTNSRVSGIGTIITTGTGSATYEFTLDAEL